MSTQINDTGAGYQIGGASTEPIGFFGATPVVQPSGSGIIPLPVNVWLDEGAGTTAALAIFADGASNVPGFTDLSSEGLGIRWNNSATPNPIITSFPKPNDADTSADFVVNILAVRSATDASDLVTFDCVYADNVVGAAAGADTPVTIASSAMTDDTNIQLLTANMVAANISSTAGAISLRVQPTDGLLDTIDVTVLGVWITYTNGAVNLGLASGS